MVAGFAGLYGSEGRRVLGSPQSAEAEEMSRGIKMGVVLATAGFVLLTAACSSTTTTQQKPKSGSTAAGAPGATPSSTAAAATVANAPVQSKALFGTAHPNYPAAIPGKVAVVSNAAPVTDPTGSTVLPVIVRNGTSKAVTDLKISSPAMKAGQVVASGESQDVVPSTLQPGQVAFAYLFFESGPVTATDTFQFTVTSSAPDNSNPFHSVDMNVTQASVQPGQFGTTAIAGAFMNPSSASASPVAIEVYCFDAGGTMITGQSGGFASQENIPGSGSGSFSVDLQAACPTFIVGATGNAGG